MLQLLYVTNVGRRYTVDYATRPTHTTRIALLPPLATSLLLLLLLLLMPPTAVI
jgi:hypothetical protein